MKLEKYLRQFTYLTENDINEFIAICKPICLDQGTSFICAGDICKKVLYLEEGIMRSYYHNVNGTENTYCISFSGTFVTAYSSLITQKNTHENIVTITPSKGYIATKEAIDILCKDNIRWVRFQKETAEMHYLELEHRIQQLQNVTAKERYEQLMIKHPEFFLYISVQQLSSYLGITPRHLSRIRREISF